MMCADCARAARKLPPTMFLQDVSWRPAVRQAAGPPGAGIGSSVNRARQEARTLLMIMRLCAAAGGASSRPARGAGGGGAIM